MPIYYFLETFDGVLPEMVPELLESVSEVEVELIIAFPWTSL